MFLFKSGTPAQTSLGLLALRVITGLYMASHGYQKVFQFGIAGLTQGFQGMGIPMAGVAAPFIAFLELIGGAMIVAGVVTRPVALLLVADMFVAGTFVHLKDGFFAPKGSELVYLFMAAFLALAFAGAGTYSVDAVINRDNK